MRPHTGSDHTLGACMAKGKFHTQWQWAELTGGGGWGWSGKGLHLRNCERGADSLFWNLSSSDSGVKGGGASLRKVPGLAAKTTKKLPKVPSCFPDLLWLGADQGRQEGVHGGILSFQIVRAASLGR